MRPEIEVLRERHSDPRRGQGLDVNQNIYCLKKPSVELNVKEPTWNEIQDIIQKAKASGAPGPSDISYKVYKNCAEVVKDFEKDLGQRYNSVSLEAGRRLFSPKRRGFLHNHPVQDNFPAKYGDLLFGTWLTTNLLHNHYIDTSIQKGRAFRGA